MSMYLKNKQKNNQNQIFMLQSYSTLAVCTNIITSPSSSLHQPILRCRFSLLALVLVCSDAFQTNSFLPILHAWMRFSINVITDPGLSPSFIRTARKRFIIVHFQILAHLASRGSTEREGKQSRAKQSRARDCINEQKNKKV